MLTASTTSGTRLHALMPFGNFVDDGVVVGFWQCCPGPKGNPDVLEGIVRRAPGAPLRAVRSTRDATTLDDPGNALLAAPEPRHDPDAAARGSVQGGDFAFIETFWRCLQLTSTGPWARVLMRPYERAAARWPAPPSADETEAHLASKAVAAAAFLGTLDPAMVDVLRDGHRSVTPNHLIVEGLDPGNGGGAPLAAAIRLAPDLTEVSVWAWGEDRHAFPVPRSRTDLTAILEGALTRHGKLPRRRLRDVEPFSRAMRHMPPDALRTCASDMLSVDDGDSIHVVALLSLLDRFPGSWRPADDAEREAFVRLGSVIEMGVDKLVRDDDVGAMFDAGEGWRTLSDRLVAAVGLPPEQLVRAMRDCTDVTEALSEQLLRPARALLQGLPADACVHPQVDGTWHGVAYSVLFSGRSATRMLQTSGRWHAARDRIEQGLAGLPGSGPGLDAWAPALPDATLGGVSVHVLASARALRAEGRRGAEQGDVPGLDHCVGGYAPRCVSGECRILSLRDGPYGRRLSTAHVEPHGTGLRVVQHVGLRNVPPPPEAAVALEAYLDMVATDPSLVGPELRARVRRPSGGRPIRESCGYDWSRPGTWETARDLWAPFLPGWMRDLGPVEFGLALGDEPRHGGQLWDRTPFASRAVQGPETPAP